MSLTATREPLVLGIESSCDETGIGLVRGTTLLANEVASSMDLHARFGGVVPEIASRAHLEALIPSLSRACDTAGVKLTDVDAIAVTVGPGLAGALMVGVAAAKALSIALDKPLYGVNHLAAHVAVDMLEHGPLPEPTMGLLVSGGHDDDPAEAIATHCIGGRLRARALVVPDDDLPGELLRRQLRDVTRSGVELCLCRQACVGLGAISVSRRRCAGRTGRLRRCR